MAVLGAMAFANPVCRRRTETTIEAAPAVPSHMAPPPSIRNTPTVGATMPKTEPTVISMLLIVPCYEPLTVPTSSAVVIVWISDVHIVMRTRET